MDYVHLKDLKNNTVVKVPFDNIGPMVKSGQYELPIGQELPIMSPDGTLGTIASHEYGTALNNGYVPATSTDIQKHVDMQTFGDSPLQTGLERAASSATFGLTDFAANVVAPEYAKEMAKREEYNPGAAIVGNVAGVVVPTLLSGGTSLAAKAISAPVRLAESAGLATTKAVAKALPNTSLAAKIVQNIVPRAAGMGVEGALYGAGSALSDVGLGKIDINNINDSAEHILADIGYSGLIGAGLGAALGAGKMAFEPLVKKVSGLADVGKLAEKYTGTDTAKGAKVYERGIKPEEVAQTLVNPEKVGISVTDNAEDIIKKFDNFKTKTGEAIDGVLKQLDTLENKNALPTNEQFIKKINDTISKLDSEMKIAGEAKPGASEFLNKLNKTKEEFKTIYEARDPLTKVTASDLQSLRQHIDELAKFDKNVMQDTDRVNIFRALRVPLRETIDEAAKKASPELAAALKTANRDYFVASSIEPFLEKQMSKQNSVFNLRDIAFSTIGHATGFGGISSAVLVGKKLAETQMAKNAQLIYAVKLAESKSAKDIAQGMHNFFVKAGDVTRPAVYKFNASKRENTETAFDRYTKQLQLFNQDPNAYMEHVQAKNVNVAKQLPNLAANIEAKGYQAAQFLNSKLPTRISPEGALLQNYKPTKSQMDKFARYAEIVDNPKNFMKHLNAGTLTKENVEAMKAVYPAMYSSIVNSAASYMSKYGGQLPYQKKLMLGNMLGVAAVSAQQPKFLQNLQAGYLQQPQQGGGAVNPTVGGLSKINKAGRLSGK